MTAATIISFTVAGIAVVSTVGSSALNIADTWGNFDNPVFNTLQSVLNWSSMISNGLYSIGMLYNSIKYKPGGSLLRRSEEASGAPKTNKSYPADDANKWWKEQMGYENPPYKPGTTVKEITLTQEGKFVRVYDGTSSRQAGG